MKVFRIWLLAVGVSTSVSAATQAKFSERFSFGNHENKITSSGGLKGKYIPSNILDNDTPETRDPKRYRVKGKVGQALKFYRSQGSYAKIDGFKMPAKSEEFYLATMILPVGSQVGAVATCRLDSSRNGFAFFVWGDKWFFQYGDGSKSYSASFKRSRQNRTWQFVEVFFNRGSVECRVNGNSLGRRKLHGKLIATNTESLFIGNYPGKQARMRYAFNGMIDELIIAKNKATADVNFSKAMVKKLPALEVICEPVTGNEMHFGGISTFHTFKDHPVPLSFKFRGDPKLLKQPALHLYLPENINLLEAFQSNHNVPEEAVDMTAKTVKLNGKTYRKYSTPGNFDLTLKLNRKYDSGKTITCALGQTGNNTSGQMYWSFSNDGKESKKHPILVKFIKPLKLAKAGKFMIMNYYFARDIAYHKPENFKKIAQLYKLSGMTGKGKSYKTNKRRSKLEDKLLDYGFTLYDISLWEGPISARTIGVPCAVDYRGKKSDKYICPTILVNSKDAIKKYEQLVKDQISIGKTKWAALDYEPWGKPGRICFCPTCIKAFKKAFNIKENRLTASIIKRKYKVQWTRYWVKNSSLMIKIMAEALRKADPNIKVVEYTYFFPYNNPRAMMNYLWNIPKDPRINEKYLDETMISMYHVNYRKAFDLLNSNMKHLKKSVSVIVTLSRVNACTGQYTTKKTALSPRQIRQKAVMCAALGVKTYGLWPGNCIDGMFHVALGNACRDIWKHEKYYYSGKRVDDKVKVVPVKTLPQKYYAYTAWRKDRKTLVTLFNFSKKTIKIKFGKQEKIVSVPAEGYRFVFLRL